MSCFFCDQPSTESRVIDYCGNGDYKEVNLCGTHAALVDKVEADGCAV